MKGNRVEGGRTMCTGRHGTGESNVYGKGWTVLFFSLVFFVSSFYFLSDEGRTRSDTRNYSRDVETIFWGKAPHFLEHVSPCQQSCNPCSANFWPSVGESLLILALMALLERIMIRRCW